MWYLLEQLVKLVKLEFKNAYNEWLTSLGHLVDLNDANIKQILKD